MTRTRGEERAETAREHDDSGIIDSAEPAPRHGGTEGGNLQKDIATQAEEERATEPDAHESVTKGDHIAHGHGESPRHPPEKVVSER